MELKTRAGQTPVELADEFISKMKAVNSGSKDMDTLFDYFISLEHKKLPPQEIIDMINHVSHTDYNATSCDYIMNMQPNISLVCLAWLSSQCSSIPDAISTLVGLYHTYFLKDHDNSEQMTLEWIGDTVGKGKLVNFRMIWQWFSASKCSDGLSCFSKLKR